MKKIFLAIILTLGFFACTDNFEEANRNQFLISDAELEQDFNLLGSPFQNMLYNLFGGQVNEDLCHDNWVRHVGTPTPFVGGVNNTTYYMRWNPNWGRIYNNIMSPGEQVIKLANEGGYDVFASFAKLIQVYGISKLTSFYGPVIYSKYGVTGEANIYDSEPDLYNNLFSDLDAIQAVFAANQDYTGLAKFDASYNGDMALWSKLVNSLRLRLAIRLSNVAPDLAKTQGEKALNDPLGLISSNGENFRVSLYGNKLYLSVICFEWGDTRMGAAMESFMVGLKDNRIAAFLNLPPTKHFIPTIRIGLIKVFTVVLIWKQRIKGLLILQQALISKRLIAEDHLLTLKYVLLKQKLPLGDGLAPVMPKKIMKKELELHLPTGVQVV